MNINSILKKEGIVISKSLSILQTNILASSIAGKLVAAFPEHHFDKQELFSSLSRLDMYMAKMPAGLAKAKYVSFNHSIYFDESLSFEDIANIAIHECIHFLQERKDENENLERLGLAHFTGAISGTALNEAAVQLMASEASGVKKDVVTYYNISFPTISSSYYPLQCLLVSQMAYFTGTYPLFHSTLYSNDIFKNTFIAKSSASTYSLVEKYLDKLVELEDVLCALTHDLQDANDNIKKIKSITTAITAKKNEIMNLFFRLQNTIMANCFHKEFNLIRNLEDIKTFKNRLYQYQDMIGTAQDYTFYHDFYQRTMIKLEQKREHIEAHGDILLGESTSTALVLATRPHNIFTFIKTFFYALKKLAMVRIGERDVSRN